MARKKATKKRVAKKRVTKRAAPKKAAQQAALPKGFTAIESGFGKSWPDDAKIGDAIQGVVTGYRDVDLPKSKGGPTQIMSIEAPDGTTYSVWRSTVLEPLFDEDHTDYEVWLRFDGLAKAKGNNNPAKLFTMAVREE